MQKIVLIDGENFKAKIAAVCKSNGKPRPKWYLYDYAGLFKKIVQHHNIDQHIFYFARIKEHPQTRNKSKQLIEEQRLLKTHLQRQGFTVILIGRVQGQIDNGTLVFKEKGVDVKIAVDMVTLSCDKKAKILFLVSSDSDLQPAVQEVIKRGVDCIYIGFEHQPNKGLKYTTQQTILISDSEVLEYIH